MGINRAGQGIKEAWYNTYMKLTKARIKQFEREQKEFSTHTALFNVLWQVAAQIFSDLGVKSVKTGMPHKKKN